MLSWLSGLPQRFCAAKALWDNFRAPAKIAWRVLWEEERQVYKVMRQTKRAADQTALPRRGVAFCHLRAWECPIVRADIGLPRRCVGRRSSPTLKIAMRLFREDKRKRRYFVRLFPFVQLLFCRDSAGRAAILASAAVDADIGIDDIRRIAGSDRIHGASIGAGAAGDAGVGDLVSHLDYLPSKS